MFLYQCWNHKCLTLILNSYFISHHISWNLCPLPQLPHLSQLNLCDFSEPISVNHNIFFSLKIPTSCMCECSVTSFVSNSLWPYGLSPPGPSVHGILQERILEWVAIPSSRGSSPPSDRTQISYSLAMAGRFFTLSTAWEDPPPPTNDQFHSSLLSPHSCWLLFWSEVGTIPVQAPILPCPVCPSICSSFSFHLCLPCRFHVLFLPCE